MTTMSVLPLDQCIAQYLRIEDILQTGRFLEEQQSLESITTQAHELMTNILVQLPTLEGSITQVPLANMKRQQYCADLLCNAAWKLRHIQPLQLQNMAATIADELQKTSTSACYWMQEYGSQNTLSPSKKQPHQMKTSKPRPLTRSFSQRKQSARPFISKTHL